MKKIIFAVLTIITMNACNSPQRMTGPNGDTMMNATDSTNMMQSDTMRRDSM